MRRKIIEQQRQLEANDLNLDLENNKSSAMYNKDLYNGVVQIVMKLKWIILNKKIWPCKI